MKTHFVRDNLTGAESEPMTREAAGAKATADTIAAGQRGEAVVVRGGIDRFVVRRA